MFPCPVMPRIFPFRSSLSKCLILFVAGGLVALCGALTYAEIGSRLPVTGGYYWCPPLKDGRLDLRALRIELEHDRLPIAVTLIKPAGIDTMFAQHAKNYMDVEPSLPAPVYAPELVAEAILYAAQHQKRDVAVGAASKVSAVGGFHFPRLFDKLGETLLWNQQRSDQPKRANRKDALYSPDTSKELRQRQGMNGVHETSPYTQASLRYKPLSIALLGGGALMAAWMLSKSASRTGDSADADAPRN